MLSTSLIGKHFGRLTVVDLGNDYIAPNGRRYERFICKCQCVNKTIVHGYSLTSGATLSCGCLHKENTKKSKTTHGFSKTRLFNIWQGMLNRCRNKNVTAYNIYGGRGITVCEEWHNFKPFSDWAHENGYEEGLTLDRIDNDGNYCPENCRWATWHEQAANKSNSNSTVGVGYNKIKGKWEARLQINGKLVLHKMFVTYQEAVVARKEAEIKYDVASM